MSGADVTNDIPTSAPGAATPAGDAAPGNLPYNRLSWRLDGALVSIGKFASWLWLIMLAVVLNNVFLRYIVAESSIALEELSWHLFGAAMMLSLAYAVVRDDHVRVDVLHENFTLRSRAWIDLVAIVLLALPVLVIAITSLVPYAYTAYIYGETSQAPSGLPHRFIIKSIIPIGLALVVVALFSRALRCSTLLFRFPQEIHPPAADAGHGRNA
jgi:TRAP-type mannitol/chloroaromatic compound transport system permease small subunit